MGTIPNPNYRGAQLSQAEADLAEFEGMTDRELALCVEYGQKGEAVGMARVVIDLADSWRRMDGAAKHDVGNALADTIDVMEVEGLTALLPAERSATLRALYAELPPLPSD